MAHAIKLGALTDELVTLLTATSSNNEPSRFNTYRESALRSLRHHSFPRTNPFDVQENLAGLEEKLRVYNKDELANVLQDRLEQLRSRSERWTDETLDFLVHLSNRPVENTKLEHLDLLLPSDEPGEPTFRWEDLRAEEPALREKHIWRNIDHAADSSGDEEASFVNYSASITDSTSSSIGDEDCYPSETFVIPPASNLEKSWLKSHFWEGKGSTNQSAQITELQVNREVLFMLGGFPTSLFNRKSDASAITPMPSFALPQVSHDTLYGWLDSCSKDGTSLLKLRNWAKVTQTFPLLQKLQSQTLEALSNFDQRLSALHSQLVAPKAEVVVSLCAMRASLDDPVGPLNKLSLLVSKLSEETYAHPFRCLELLFDATAEAQEIGDEAVYQFMGAVFLECFCVYLLSIKLWMDEGELLAESNMFFVLQAEGGIDPSCIWQDGYKLRKTSSGSLHAPKFLRAASNKIFNAGKSVVLLKMLGLEYMISGKPRSEASFDFQFVCGPSTVSLVPFTSLFDEAVEQWIQDRHHTASAALQSALLDNLGLHVSLDAMEKIYFMADGAASSPFINGVFSRIDSGKPTWSDTFILTELAQSSLGELDCVNANRLMITTTPLGHRKKATITSRTVRSLSTIMVIYRLPWPVQIVITEPASLLYKKIFTFLFQIRRASHILQSFKLVQSAAKEAKEADFMYYGIRSRLLWFTSTLYDHVTNLVISDTSLRLREELSAAEDVDRMIRLHEQHIKRIVDGALLGTRLEPIMESVIAILDLAVQLSDAHATYLAASAVPEPWQSPLRVPASKASQRNLRYNHKSSEDEDSSDSDFSVTLSVDAPLSYIDQLRSFRGQFDNLSKFIAHGLRAVARAGGDASWDILAEKLELGF